MITAKDLDPPVKVGRNAHKLAKNWQAKWILALRGDTHSVWYEQGLVDDYERRVLARTEANKGMPVATMQELAEEDLLEFESDGDVVTHNGGCMVLENGYTPATFYQVGSCELDQQLERRRNDEERKRVGLL